MTKVYTKEEPSTMNVDQFLNEHLKAVLKEGGSAFHTKSDCGCNTEWVIGILTIDAGMCVNVRPSSKTEVN